jgi:hypothetical protein
MGFMIPREFASARARILYVKKPTYLTAGRKAMKFV